MSQPSKDSDPSSKAPVCPECGLPLRRKGKVVDTGRFKKWVEDWHCETHGKVDVPEKPSK
jgi:hypothetical protein